MRLFTYRRVPAGAKLGLVLAMSLAPLSFQLGTTPGRAEGRTSPAVSAAPEEVKSSPAHSAAADPLAAKPDYYTRRATEMVQQDENLLNVTPHHLAAAYPEYTVVVCDAGCPKDRGPEVVYFTRKDAGEVVRHATMVPTSSDLAASDLAPPPSARIASQAIDCIGGCYDTPKRYPARLAVERAAVSKAPSRVAAPGPWVTTLTREGGAPELMSPQQ